MSDAGNRLFVYGTLKPGADHPLGGLLADHSNRLGAGWINARLYVVTEVDALGENSYPGALPSPSPSDRVYGEVYDILDPDHLFPKFDLYEACTPDWPEPYEFLRRRTPVQMENGSSQWAWCYFYTWDVSGAVHLPSGRFEESSPRTR